jgi:hypothetical protein
VWVKESFASPASPLAAAPTPVNAQGRLDLCVSIGGMDKLRHILWATLAWGRVIPSQDHGGWATRATSASQISIEL